MVQILTLVFATLIFKRTTTVFENHHNKVLFSNPYIVKMLDYEPLNFDSILEMSTFETQPNESNLPLVVKKVRVRTPPKVKIVVGSNPGISNP